MTQPQPCSHVEVMPEAHGNAFAVDLIDDQGNSAATARLTRSQLKTLWNDIGLLLGEDNGETS